MWKILSLIVISAGFSGCGLLSFPSLNAPKPPDQVYKYSQLIEKQPQLVTTADGKTYVWESQKQTLDVNYERKDKPLTAWQKFTNWLGNLGFLSIALLIGCLIAFPGATLGFLWKRYSAYKKALVQTVAAIEETKVVNKDVEVKNALAANQDASTKKLIDDIKRS